MRVLAAGWAVLSRTGLGGQQGNALFGFNLIWSPQADRTLARRERMTFQAHDRACQCLFSAGEHLDEPIEVFLPGEE